MLEGMEKLKDLQKLQLIFDKFKNDPNIWQNANIRILDSNGKYVCLSSGNEKHIVNVIENEDITRRILHVVNDKNLQQTYKLESKDGKTNFKLIKKTSKSFLWENEWYVVGWFCAIFVLVVMYIYGYETEDIFHVILAVAGIDTQLHGVISALSNITITFNVNENKFVFLSFFFLF